MTLYWTTPTSGLSAWDSPPLSFRTKETSWMRGEAS